MEHSSRFPVLHDMEPVRALASYHGRLVEVTSGRSETQSRIQYHDESP